MTGLTYKEVQMTYIMFYSLMLIGFGGMTVLSPGIKLKCIGALLFFVNALIYFKWGK
jgi:hypothetical protein